MLSAAVQFGDAPAEPIELEDAKRFLRIDGDAQNGDVDLLIEAARLDIEAATSTRLMAQTVRLQAGCFLDLAHLNVGPVTGVVRVGYRDSSGVEQEVDLATVYLTGLALERGIEVAPGHRWPYARPRSITVDLQVGYGAAGDVPANLRHALLALMRGKRDDRVVDLEPLIVNHRIYG